MGTRNIILSVEDKGSIFICYRKAVDVKRFVGDIVCIL